MSNSRPTRVTSQCPVLGTSKKLCRTVLPTYGDILRSYLLMRESSIDMKWIHSRNRLCEDVRGIWYSASLPTLSERRINAMLDAYHTKYRNLMKPYQVRKENPSYQLRMKQFSEDSRELFDIAACKCKNILLILKESKKSLCTCPEDRKIPRREIKFLIDQRDPEKRKMFIGNTDACTTKQNQKFVERKQYRLSLTQENMSTSSVSSMPQSPAVTKSFESPNSNESKSDDTTYDASIKAKPVFKRKLLSSLALACDRSGISDRAAAHVSSAVLKDIGVIT